MDRVSLKSNAKAQLKGKWGLAVITSFVSILIISGFYGIVEVIEPRGGILTIISRLISLLLGGLITFGLSKFVLNIATYREANFDDLFSGINIYLKTLGLWVVILVSVFIATIFLIVPGIIVGLMFSQAFFILCEDNQKTIMQCLKESSEIMIGHKVDLFVLELSFIGWWILVIITFGIASLWVYPYQEVTCANFYLSLRKNKQKHNFNSKI